ncbi:hypothetical protein GCM10023096_36730 [Nonomuraea ferruginea]
MPRRLVVPQPRRRRPPVEHRHHHVERDQIRPHLQHPIQAILPIGGRLHLEPLKVEIDGDELTNDLVIVYDQNFAKNVTHGGQASGSGAVTWGFLWMCWRTVIWCGVGAGYW